jgi:hypothetical protein
MQFAEPDMINLVGEGRIPCSTGAGGVGSIPANPDALNVPSFRRWRFEMKLSPLINLELKSAFGDSRQADEHPILAVGLLQILLSANKKCASESDDLTRIFYMPNQEGCIKANVPLNSVGFLQAHWQCVQQCPVPYNKS